MAERMDRKGIFQAFLMIHHGPDVVSGSILTVYRLSRGSDRDPTAWGAAGRDPRVQGGLWGAVGLCFLACHGFKPLKGSNP